MGVGRVPSVRKEEGWYLRREAEAEERGMAEAEVDEMAEVDGMKWAGATREGLVEATKAGGFDAIEGEVDWELDVIEV
jgi:hypothetical protein